MTGGAYSASQRTSSKGAIAAGLSPVSTGVIVRAIRQIGEKPNMSLVRAPQRIGFQGKKSMRAEVN